MKLRPYQTACRNALYQWFEVEDGNPLVVMATGTGKSVSIADFIRDVQQAWPDQRIICAVDVQELIAQNYAKLIQIWPDASAGIYSAGLGKRHLHQKTLFVGIQSVYNKAHKIQRCDILVVDEAHMISEKESGMWQQFIRDLKQINPHMKIIGFTATEFRLDSGLLHTGENRMFDGIAYRYGLKDAIDDGYLVEIVPKNMATKVDLEGMKKRGGDFIESEQGKRWNIDEVTKSAVNEILEYAVTRKSCLIFSSGVDHAYAIAQEIRERGETVAVVTGDTPDGERRTMLEAFKAGKIKFVVNNAVLTKGFDHPFLDLIAVLRKTLSPVLWLQILGRGTRTVIDLSGFNKSDERREAIAGSAKPNCVLLDFGGNTRHFGPADQIKFKDKGEKGDGVPPMKDCPQCDALIFAGCRTCPAPVDTPHASSTPGEFGGWVCGHAFPEPELKIEATAASNAVISSQIARKEKTVTAVDYLFHEGRDGKKPTLRVNYRCGLERFSEWICVEHPMGSFPRDKAARWWRERFDYDAYPDLQMVPQGVEEALGLIVGLKKPSKIWVKERADNHKFFEIVGYDFSAPVQAPAPVKRVDMYELEDTIPF